MEAVQRRWAAAVAVTMLAVAASTAQAQMVSPAAAPAPAGGIDSACLTSLLNTSDCLPYVQRGSTTRRPDKPCCPELAGLVDSNPVCLCELLAGAADSYGIAIDYSRALALPGICHVATPPVSTCTALGYNVHLGPSAAPISGSPSPSDEGPHFTEITEKKDGDAVCVFDPGGDLPCAHEANEWGACKESKGDVLRLMRICSAYTPIWAREKEREVGPRGGNMINQVSINMVFYVLSTKFMKLCGPMLKFPMRTKIIFRKPIKSSFQRIKWHVIWSFVQKVMAIGVHAA